MTNLSRYCFHIVFTLARSTVVCRWWRLVESIGPSRVSFIMSVFPWWLKQIQHLGEYASLYFN